MQAKLSGTANQHCQTEINDTNVDLAHCKSPGGGGGMENEG